LEISKRIKSKERYAMKTAEKIIAYLEMELADAYEQHEEARGKDAQQALVHLIRATTILNILEAIRE
jgi:hypothetical protein